MCFNCFPSRCGRLASLLSRIDLPHPYSVGGEALLRAEGMVPSSPLEPCPSSVILFAIPRRGGISWRASMVLGVPWTGTRWSGRGFANLVIAAVLGINFGRLCTAFCSGINLFQGGGVWGILDQPDLMGQLGRTWLGGSSLVAILIAINRHAGRYWLFCRKHSGTVIGILKRQGGDEAFRLLLHRHCHCNGLKRWGWKRSASMDWHLSKWLKKRTSKLEWWSCGKHLPQISGFMQRWLLKPQSRRDQVTQTIPC